MSKINRIGIKYGKLTVIKEAENRRGGKILWECICDCGNRVVVPSGDLATGHTQSCGCIRIKNLIKRNSSHGKSKTRLYRIWCAMKSRCTNKNYTSYCHYGGRGIQICEGWKNFENFEEWANNNGYEDNLSIERIDVDGNYEPNNCKWITIGEQANNTTHSRYITYLGERKTVRDWAKDVGLEYSCLFYRLDNGWDIQKALEIPSRAKKNN